MLERLLHARTGMLAIMAAALLLLSFARPSEAHAIEDVPGFDSISAGRFHTCGVKAGGVQCWGGATSGQLGNFSVNDSPVPVPVIGVASGVEEVEAGDGATCAIKDGGAYCWGRSSLGQTGTPPEYGKCPDGACAKISRPLSLTTGVTAITSGGSHGCAVKDGGLWCWGLNDDGQLGSVGGSLCGSSTCQRNPVAVPGFDSGVTAVSAGGSHTCAIRDGGAWCWGRNSSGQLGDNSQALSAFPVAVSGLSSGVSHISAGSTHTCAIKDGGAYCWGSNSQGEIGDNTSAMKLVPTPVNGLATGVSQLSAGLVSTCAVQEGAALCWGSNGFGRLGNGSAVTNSPVPVAVTGLADGVAEVTAGGFHSCSLVAGRASCWGAGNRGALGIGSFVPPSTTPIAVIRGVLAVSAGEAHTCALEDGRVSCWGANTSGQLGDNSTTPSSVPVSVMNLTGVSAISAGGEHTCAVRDDGVWCWGANAHFQLGTLSNTPSLVPVQAAILGADVAAISAGDEHNCVLVLHEAWCWGSDAQGQVGYGATLEDSSPTPLVLGITVDSIDAGLAHTCATRDDVFDVRCWGDNQYGQLGDDTMTDRPEPVAAQIAGGLYPEVATGGGHSCLALDDEVSCWGRNGDGQLGDNSTTDSTVPVTTVLAAGRVVREITSGEGHTCILRDNLSLEDREAWCWGDNASGQLGNDSTTDSLVPVQVPGLTTGVTAISAGYHHTCALQLGVVRCWGANASGQLGNGSTEPSLVPVAASWDADGDGCSDVEESATATGSEAFGGKRDPLTPWDFFDVTGDAAIDLADALAILARFGAQSGDENYDPLFDRYIPDNAAPWRTAAAVGTHLGIDLGDALVNLQSFGHNCS